MTRVMKLLIACALVVGLGVSSVFILDVFKPTFVTLEGNTPSVVSQGRYLAAADPNEIRHVVIGLKVTDQQILDKLIRDQKNPASPDYHKWLKPDEFRDRFSPTQADVDLVVKFFTSKNLTVKEVTPNRLLVVVQGKTSDFEKAFNVRLKQFKLAGVAGATNDVFTSNDADPQIPSNLGRLIDSVSGLSDLTVFQSHAIKEPQSKAVQGPQGYTPADHATVYNYPTTVNPNSAMKYTGNGRTIAIATAYGYAQTDIETYWNAFGVKRTGSLTNIQIGGSITKINGETTLDLEAISSQVPGADIIMYEGVDPAFGTFTLVYSRVATDNKADVMSVSWGMCEEFTGAAQIRTESMVLRQVAAQGIATFVASGDDGAYDCPIKIIPYYSVDFPSSDPNVTAVGGTTLLQWGGTRFFEVAWAKSGGGMSKIFGRPDYQYGNGVGDNHRRHLADVSMDADPRTGYAIFFDGEWGQYGGTSIAAPHWAAAWTVVTEAAGMRLGAANPDIYRAARSSDYAKLFFDVTQGSNGAGRGTGYPAGPGYDHPTGWGTPNVTALVNWLTDGKPVPPVFVLPPTVFPLAVPAPAPGVPPAIIAPGGDGGPGQMSPR